MDLKTIDKRLGNIESLMLTTKDVLTLDEVAYYTGIGKSYLYKLTHRKEIPHYKPRGGKIFFNKAEVDQWLQKNRVTPDDELRAKANTFAMIGKGGAR